YLALRVIPHWRWRAAALALAVSIIVAIASSRIYLGVHWISDVGAGMAAGLLWVTTTTVAYETFRRIRMIRALRAKRDVSSRAGARDPGGRGARHEPIRATRAPDPSLTLGMINRLRAASRARAPGGRWSCGRGLRWCTDSRA